VCYGSSALPLFLSAISSSFYLQISHIRSSGFMPHFPIVHFWLLAAPVIPARESEYSLKQGDGQFLSMVFPRNLCTYLEDHRGAGTGPEEIYRTSRKAVSLIIAYVA